MVDKVRVVKVGDKIEIGGNKRFALIAGPCVIESEELVMEVAGKIKDICDRLGIQYIFKASLIRLIGHLYTLLEDQDLKKD